MRHSRDKHARHVFTAKGGGGRRAYNVTGDTSYVHFEGEQEKKGKGYRWGEQIQ